MNRKLNIPRFPTTLKSPYYPCFTSRSNLRSFKPITN